MDLTLETREQADASPHFRFGNMQAVMTPPIDENYWAFRVRLGESGQAIVVFPKFGGWGCGFAQEEDWNTNLPVPYSSPQEVFDHIIHNKGDDAISDADVLEAIQMVHDAAAKASVCKRRETP